MHSKLRRGVARWARMLLVATALLVALAALFTQTPWFNTLARNLALRAVNNAIRGSVQVGRLDGNLLRTIDLRDVVLVGEGDTIAAIPHIRIRYNLPGIFQGALEVDSAVVDTPRLFLRQHDDGTWNLSHAFAAAQTHEKKTEDTARSSFTLAVRRLVIAGAVIHMFPRDTSTLLPREARLTFEGSGSYTGDRQELSATRMTAAVSHPDIVITGCTFSADNAAGELRLRDFVLTTPSNRIESSGRVTLTGNPRGTATVAASLPDLTEFGFIVPPEIRSMHPEIQADAELEGDRLDVRFVLRDGRQTVQGTGGLTLTGIPRYSFSGELHHLDPGVLRDKVKGGVDLNGSVAFRGAGFHAGDAVARGGADFAESRAGAHRIRKLHLGGEYARGEIAARGNIDAEAGYLTFEASGNVRSQRPRFSIEAESKDLDIARLLHRPISSRVTMRLVARGQGYAPSGMEGDLRAWISRSMVAGFDIDSAQVHARASNGDFRVDSLFVKSPVGEVRGGGEVSRHAVVGAQFSGIVRSLQPLHSMIGAEKTTGEGTFEGSVEGRADSLVVPWSLHLGGLAVNDFSSTAIDGTGRLRLEKGIAMVSGRADVKGLRQGGVRIDSMNVEGDYGAGRGHAIVQAKDSTLFGLGADVSARIDTTVALTIRKLDIAQGNSRWSNGEQPIAVNIRKGSVEVRGLTMTSANGSVVAEGLIVPDGITQLDLAVHNLDLVSLSRLFDTSFTSLGPLDARLSVAGRMTNPVIEGTIASSRVAYGGWESDSIVGSFAVRDSVFRWDLTAGLAGENTLRLSGYLPVQFARTEGMISRTRPMDIRLAAPRLDLSAFIHQLGPFNIVKGNLAADLHLTRTLQSPGIVGSIGIEGGLLQSASLGISYDDIMLRCTGRGDSLVIDSSHVRGGKGVITARGTAGLGPGLMQGKLGHTNILISASDFEAANTANYSATLNGAATIKNTGDRFYAEGDLVLSRSHIYLPYFTRTLGSGEREEAPPMLVAATHAGVIPELSHVKPSGEAGSPKADSTQRFGGKIRLTIPRGTWVRGKSLNLELSGNLEIVRTTPSVSISGFIRCERGTYEFYGKKFVVKEGRLDFDGGKEINPTITAEMRYEFRDAYEQQQSLHMILANRIKSMTIRFTLGDEAITDGDAISYLLFGRRSDELSQSQEAGLANIGEVV
ncbi:MAG TPA: translocation/assembly module TamB domain-containing protein, partial [Bacteroidota bacterium]|nr:translocation/assembly module TamB domain-containing protein [Bacteroidota bacterium]